MHQRKMRLIKHMIQVVVIIVDLGWRELAFVHDVLGGQGAYVKPLCKSSVQEYKQAAGNPTDKTEPTLYEWHAFEGRRAAFQSASHQTDLPG